MSDKSTASLFWALVAPIFAQHYRHMRSREKKVIAPLIEEDACLKQAFSAYEKLDDID